MSTTARQVPDPEVPAKPRSRTYTAAYKNRILAGYESLGKVGKGALLQIITAIVAFRLDREPLRPLWVLPQQLAYRQLMYLVLLQSDINAPQSSLDRRPRT
jgi:hypothetical protein